MILPLFSYTSDAVKVAFTVTVRDLQSDGLERYFAYTHFIKVSRVLSVKLDRVFLLRGCS
jgi:hypothetical protein